MRPKKRTFIYLKYVLNPAIILQAENLNWSKVQSEFTAEVVYSDLAVYHAGMFRTDWPCEMFNPITAQELKKKGIVFQPCNTPPLPVGY